MNEAAKAFEVAQQYKNYQPNSD